MNNKIYTKVNWVNDLFFVLFNNIIVKNTIFVHLFFPILHTKGITILFVKNKNIRCVSPNVLK